MSSIKTTILIIIIITIINIFSVYLFIFAHPASAIDFKAQVPIPDFKDGPIDPYSIGRYIRAIYNYAIGVVGILAVVMMMVGGIVWLTAGGSAERIGEAKSYIGASITGLLLVLSSYTILKTVNPNLIEFKPIDPIKAGPSSNLVCCNQVSGPVSRVAVTDYTNNITNYVCPSNSITIECAQNQQCTKSGTSYYSCTVKTSTMCCYYLYLNSSNCSDEITCPSDKFGLILYNVFPGARCNITTKKCE